MADATGTSGTRWQHEQKGMRMKTSLTEKQQTVLDYIKGYAETNHCGPTQDELAKNTFVKYQSASRYYLQVLKRKGYIDFTPFEPRAVKVIESERVEQ